MRSAMIKTARKTALLLAAAAFALTAVLGFAACAKKNDSPKLEHSFNYFYSPSEMDTVFFRDAEKLPDLISGNVTKLASANGTTGYVTAASALYRIDETGLLKLYPAAVTSAVLSLENDHILFATATKAFLYDHAANGYTEIEGMENIRSIAGLVLSPDGRSVGIVAVTKDGTIESYTYINGETKRFGEQRCITGIGDGGGICYYLTAENGEVGNELHFVRGDKDSVIASGAAPYFEYSRDLSEVTFDVNGKTNYSKNGSAAKQLVNGSVFSYKGAQYAAQGGKAFNALLKNTDTLLDSIFYAELTGADQSGATSSSYDIYYVDRSLNANKLAGGASQFTVSDDFTAILCVVDDALYRVTAYAPKKPVLLASNVYSFCADEKLEEVYVIDLAGNLSSCDNGIIGPVLVYGVELVKRGPDGTMICYAPSESNGTLLWLKDGRSNAISDNVAYYETFPGTVMFLRDEGAKEGIYDLYVSTNGVDFTLAAEDIGVK